MYPPQCTVGTKHFVHHSWWYKKIKTWGMFHSPVNCMFIYLPYLVCYILYVHSALQQNVLLKIWIWIIQLWSKYDGCFWDLFYIFLYCYTCRVKIHFSPYTWYFFSSQSFIETEVQESGVQKETVVSPAQRKIIITSCSHCCCRKYISIYVCISMFQRWIQAFWIWLHWLINW